MILFVLAWMVATIILGLPFYAWLPHVAVVVLALFLGAVLDRPFYVRQMPALWKHLPASDAELDRIITAHELQRMNDDMGEEYWAVGGREDD
jgi:membrane protein implicated in regulation of membrane protease activity